MKNNRVTKLLRGHRKLLLLLLLLGVAVVLSSCYVEPDRIVDDSNGLTIGTEGQNFDIVITSPPPATPTPTPTEASQQINWADWDFSSDTATNQPSTGVQPTSASGSTATATVASGTSATPTPTVQNTTTDNSILKSGSTGTAVKQLQQRLKELGYYTGSVDGSYGAATVQAVKDFQTINSLTADGVAGTKTQDAAYGKYAIPKSSSTSGSTSGTTTAAPTTNSPTTTNTYTNGKTNLYLRLGSTGDQVKILQNRLIYLGYLAGTADGTFAETTEAAVVAFQSRNGLTADGVAGPETLEKLYSTTARKASSVVAYLGSLRLGMNGDGVRAMQSRLKTLNYYSGSVDGDFGQNTYAAVVSFQTTNGLTADGVAGKETLNLLYSGTGTSSGSTDGTSNSTATDPATYGESASSTGYKTMSSTNSPPAANVKALQTSLSSLGYYTGTLDGKYGSGTTTAVMNYQASNGLRVTGTAGPAMQRMLYGGTAATGSYAKLQSGSTGADVRNLQYTLYELKFYDGEITGVFDEATENAVRDFQDVNGLTVDGVAGQDTLRKLYSSSAEALSSEIE
jgi:peptidoglycan hydrolase-like protein with peptidoglycan-binding domain